MDYAVQFSHDPKRRLHPDAESRLQDWRDVIPRLSLPTLVVGGRVSAIPWKSVEWTARQVKGSRLEIFEEDEGGNHFMFIENPSKFNRIVADFIG
ncbi:MAG TPA: hypothetical protein HPP90_01090 [Deltaproteobacteria bacterium]|nr:hypothetical protein [Deltaproteobacteria bacterium]